MNKTQILDEVGMYFENKIFENHKKRVLKEHSTLKAYKINPIVVKYLSKILDDDFTPEGIAKALYYPRVLGTSINTSFGTRIQNMFVELGLAKGSLIPGMDIEFIDKIDKRRKWCQLKSGPNTINSGDVSPLLKKFSKVSNLARTNSIKLNNSDLILGVLYGTEDQLSQHYREIDKTYPVIIGTQFWQRITGYEDFYEKIVIRIDEVIIKMETTTFFEDGLASLSKEISASKLFTF